MILRLDEFYHQQPTFTNLSRLNCTYLKKISNFLISVLRKKCKSTIDKENGIMMSPKMLKQAMKDLFTMLKKQSCLVQHQQWIPIKKEKVPIFILIAQKGKKLFFNSYRYQKYSLINSNNTKIMQYNLAHLYPVMKIHLKRNKTKDKWKNKIRRKRYPTKF